MLFFKASFPATPSSPSCADKEEEENLPSRRKFLSTKLKEVTDAYVTEKETPKRRGRTKKVFLIFIVNH